ncbi:uncharacterized protein JCM10292_007575 [Rhodotorula paludigena]|uniref:uncharacterized protein n=1 Tax=Rhodotorula paludigena TaxID=86838 RepID=UPI00316D3193
MADGDAPSPLSLRDRIKQLEAAANSPLSTPAPLQPSSRAAPAPRPSAAPPHPDRTSSASVPSGPSSTRGTPNTAQLRPPALNGVRAPSPVSTTPPDPPPSPRLPVAQLLSRYNQSQPQHATSSLTTDTTRANAAGLKTDPASAATSPVAAQGERPSSPTALRAPPSRPLFGQKKQGAAAEPGGAEAALSAQLGATGEAGRSRAGSSGTGAALSGSPKGRPSPQPAWVAKKPPPPPRPPAKPTEAVSSDRSSPASPTRSASLNVASPSLAPSPSSAPQLPPRRSATLSSTSSSPASNGPSPSLPPRPGAGPAPSPRWVPPPPSTTTPSAGTPRAASTAPRPALASKATTHDPLSAALATASKPYAPPSLSSQRLSSAYPSLSRASTQRQPARRPQVSSDSVPDASPARKADGADPDTGARRRYVRVFEQCCAATRADVGPQPGSGDEKTLAAPVVAELWRRSRLPDHELRKIWDGVAGSQAGLTAEQFAAGMWAIDEELRRRQKKGR